VLRQRTGYAGSIPLRIDRMLQYEHQEESAMGFAKIKGELTSRIGCRVRFGPPADVHRAGGLPGSGTIIDETWATPEINKTPARPTSGAGDWGDYSFCAQLIKWDDEGYSIRLAYYRRRAGEDWWEYASQMTVNSDWRTIKALLERTLSKESWFTDTPEWKISGTAAP
jgi:hypothetical protein